MEEVLRAENMREAYERVVRNDGAPGVDGVSCKELRALLVKQWAQIKRALKQGTYEPAAVRKVDIPKASGGTRTLGIPTVVDRMIQQAIAQVLGPYFDKRFSKRSYGFRPGLSTHDAVRAATKCACYNRWVVDIDIEKFFDRVNHDILMAKLARHIADKKLLKLIRRYLESGMMEGGVVTERTEGTPQGGPLSPLLSNVMLDALDKELEKREHRFVRYADDCNIYVKSQSAAKRVLESISLWLERKLKLKVNPKKSKAARTEEVTFLGFSAEYRHKYQAKVSEEAKERVKLKVKDLLRKGRGRKLTHTFAALAPLIRGWVQYFGLDREKTTFRELDQWLRRSLRRLIWRQWKTPANRYRQLRRRRVNAELARSYASSRYGPQRLSNSEALHRAFTNRWFVLMGLPSFLEEHGRIDASLNRRMPNGTSGGVGAGGG